eukprot:35409_1
MKTFGYNTFHATDTFQMLSETEMTQSKNPYPFPDDLCETIHEFSIKSHANMAPTQKRLDETIRTSAILTDQIDATSLRHFSVEEYYYTLGEFYAAIGCMFFLLMCVFQRRKMNNSMQRIMASLTAVEQ